MNKVIILIKKLHQYNNYAKYNYISAKKTILLKKQFY